MAGQKIINIEKQQTQTLAAVKALLAWRGRAADPLPEYVEMGMEESRLVLVLSNKKDCFYVVTARDCSCPARNWHPNGPCKHMRKYFPEQTAIKPAAAGPNAGKWHGHNGPWIEEEKPVASIPLVDTLGEPTARDVAYWQIAEDKAMWPAEA